MVQSMTGFGKAECDCGHSKITIEIKSVNGKGCDISLKSQVIPREKEIEVKQMLSSMLQRGSIDLFATLQTSAYNNIRTINKEVVLSYFNQLKEISLLIEETPQPNLLMASLLKFPEVIDSTNLKDENEELIKENWDKIDAAIKKAANMLIEFRKAEGKRLYEELTHRVSLIIEYLKEAENFDYERVESVKKRLKTRLEEVTDSLDMNRYEQEIIYYLEKLDITEEKVRLQQHCNYFLDTMENEEYSGKKLGFILQEMGREINTLGSKANHAGIQKLVVQMKDELEKIKEQSLNLL